MFCVAAVSISGLCGWTECVYFVTYGNGEVGVQEELEVNGLGVRVLEAEVDVEVVLGEVHGVRELGRVGPLCLVVRAQGGRVEEELERHPGAVLLGHGRVKRPRAVAGEAVRGQLGRLALVWWRPEVGEDDGDAAADGGAAVEGRGGRQEDLLVAVAGLPRCHRRSVEVDRDGVTAGQRGLDGAFALDHGGWRCAMG